MSTSIPSSKTWASQLFATEMNTLATPGLVTNKDIALSTMTMMMTDESNNMSNTGITGSTSIWYSFDRSLQKDRDVALTAVKMRCIPTNLSEWPLELLHDIQFWNALLSYQGKGPYDDGNDGCLLSNTGGWCVPEWKRESQIQSVLHRHPTLEGNVNFWYTVLNANYVSSQLLIDKAHESILSNKEFMICAMQNDFTVYDALCAPLNQDEEIVVTALQQHTDAIIYIPAFIQELYPDAVAQSIRNWSDIPPKRCKQIRKIYSRGKFHFAEYVSAVLWTNRDVILAWAAIGGNYQLDRFPPECINDEELFLLYAQHNANEFQYASSNLRSDKEYMKKAIGFHGPLLCDALYDLRYDFDLAVIAFATKESVISYIDGESDEESLLRFFDLVNKKKLEHDAFFLFVLAVSIVSPHHEEKSIKSSLSLLNQGNETTTILLKIIQQFVGSPKGIDLQRIRLARKHSFEYFQEHQLDVHELRKNLRMQ